MEFALPSGEAGSTTTKVIKTTTKVMGPLDEDGFEDFDDGVSLTEEKNTRIVDNSVQAEGVVGAASQQKDELDE